MLVEQFICSTANSVNSNTSHHNKDIGIVIYDYQPVIKQSSTYKKSATAPNCIAISEEHVFAAQHDKAVVHVYNREKSNQEATVPFSERITAITLACDDSVLAIGTAEGRIFLWELSTGRQITTDQSHLQKVTHLAVDPSSNFLVSASADSTVQVWSLISLLSFRQDGIQLVQPHLTFDAHRSEITAVALGHSYTRGNIALTASKDRTCLVWGCSNGVVLRTYLLPEVPTCVELDATDRFAYVGYDDGTLQQLDLFVAQADHIRSVLDPTKASDPIQPPKTSRFQCQDPSVGAVLCVSVSFDGSTILSGHQSGAILAWDTGKLRFQSNLTSGSLADPVTNLQFLPIRGLPQTKSKRFTTRSVVKPKFGAFDSLTGNVPTEYTIHAKLSDQKPLTVPFEQALYGQSFPDSMIDEGLNELEKWRGPSNQANSGQADEPEDFMALDSGVSKVTKPTLEEQNKSLKSELEAMRRLQRASLDKIEELTKRRRHIEQQDGHGNRRMHKASDVREQWSAGSSSEVDD